MKTTELTIGDWVKIPNTKAPYRRIWAIEYPYDNSVYVNDYGSEDSDDSYPIYHIEPIPLIPEILEKNGWKDKNNISDCLGIEVFADEKKLCGVEFCADDEYSFNTYERWEKTDYDGAPTNWGYRYINTIYRLHYVHELQHALRLCGLDELADNFKV